MHGGVQLTYTSKSYKYIKSGVFKTIIFIFSDNYRFIRFSKRLGFHRVRVLAAIYFTLL